MWTTTDWCIFGALVLSFASLITIATYLGFMNDRQRDSMEEMRQSNEYYKRQLEKMRHFIAERDREFRIPNDEITRVIGTVDTSLRDEAGLLIRGALDVTETGRHRKPR